MLKKKDKPGKPGKTVWREALEAVGGLMLWTLRLGLSAVAFTSIASVMAGGIVPWVMTTLAGGLGVTAETALLDMIFIYGASGLFAVILMAMATFALLKWINGQFARLHGFLARKLLHKEGG